MSVLYRGPLQVGPHESRVQSGVGRQITSINCWARFFLCSPGHNWLSGWQVPISSSCPFFHPPLSPGQSMRIALGLLSNPLASNLFCIGDCCDLGAGSLAWFYWISKVHVCPLLKPIKVLLDNIPSLHRISHHSAWCYWQTGWGCTQHIPLGVTGEESK